MVRKPGTPEEEAQVREISEQLEASVQQAKPSIHTKMVAIMAVLGTLEPTGRNTHFRYDYFEASEVAGTFRKLFVKQGLSFVADVVDFDIKEGRTSKGGSTWLTTLKVLFTITDTYSGETISGHGIGQGDDPGDKGSNKAFAGALKYWLLKTFVVGGEDAEADDRTDRRGGYDDAPDVVVEGSNIQGIERGGRSTNATDVQVKRIRQIAKDLGYGVTKTANLIEEILDTQIEFDVDDPEEMGPAFVKYLEGMGADDAGKVIQYMEKMVDAP